MLVFAGLLALIGLGMVALGGWLLALGGTLYYLVAGALLVVGFAVMLWRRDGLGLGLQALALVLTLAWALWEIAGKGWSPSWGFDLAGRVGLLAGLFALTLLAWAMGASGRQAHRWRPASVALLAGGVGAIAVTLAIFWERTTEPVPGATAAVAGAAPAVADTDWTAFGGTHRGERFSPALQITPANVHRLTEVWRFSTGDMAPNPRVFFSAQNTPQKIGDTLFMCSPSNIVYALDPATGREQWRFNPGVSPEVMESVFSVACRSLGYHDAGAEAGAQACARRVFVTTADSRLIALDAATGTPCAGFGTAGVVDLSIGMDMGQAGFAYSNSGPAVIGGQVVVGQQVSDNQSRRAPSGVVRAYDAITGELTWAWDAMRLDRPREPLAPGEVWPRGTPNVWNVISGDEELGLVYLGTGNAAADHFGGDRTPEEDLYSSAVVAVDMVTGETRWFYRTVLNDRWDYDIGAQPVVTDLEIGGQTRRVLIQAVKTGSIFVLDARTGDPLRPVEQRPAPQAGALPREVLAPAQPQSVFYPNFAGRPGPDPERLDPRHAFGLTPLDAAWCRIQFHRMTYDGIYTPPGENPHGMLLFPGTIGGPNWGGLAIDRDRRIVVTNHSRLPNVVTMHPRAQVRDLPIGEGGARPDQEIAPHAETPWGVTRPIWVSPLDVPCIAPPWGYLAATDLNTGRLLWSQPLGTGYDMGPLGMRSLIRVPIGTPNVGGAVATASGLTFIAAAQDDYFRAFETATGRLLWTVRLPAGGQASAMTYMHRGRQYVAIGATGHARLGTRLGDHLLVYALGEAR